MEKAKCCDCGYEWLKGQHGGHSCVNQLRQQLEAAEAEIKRLKSAWQVEILNRKDQLIAAQEAENDRLKQIIREAREQKPIAEVAGAYAGAYEVGNIIFSTDKISLALKTKLYAAPVPAMPIQDYNPAVAAIQFALENEDPVAFLHLWNEGEFDALRENWEGIPDDVFIGADPLFKSEVKPSC